MQGSTTEESCRQFLSARAHCQAVQSFAVNVLAVAYPLDLDKGNSA